ncbi:MAG: flagellar M-ring protein FliF [Lachnospiraceae bacterium]|nr:flagellar M-ring protein FliF [Lachnospiraceae bacterium]
MKEKLGQFKEFFLKLGKKTKILIGAGLIVLVAVAVILALVLNRKEYEILYSDVNTDEAQQIIGLLQESAIDYRYDGEGTIYVPEANVDQVKASLASQGYPKSGFTYDIFRNNATMMTTDSDKQTYKMYELQDRIGATISLFDNVKDAKVTIALGEQQKYALDDSKQQEASASVVMMMQDNGSPTQEQAAAVKNLVSKAIPGMTIDNVGVFDGNGLEVIVEEKDGSNVDSQESEEIARMVESQVSQKVLNVLTPVFGANNVRVSAKARVNMETLVRESINYATPEKRDQNDKTGLISKESGSRETTQDEGTAGGVAGTETNADVPEYNTDGDDDDTRYANQQYDREYLVDQIKEQGQVPAGAIEDMSVSVTVNAEDLGDIDEDDLKSVIGNAAGIELVDQDEKVAVLAAPFFEAQDDTKTASAGGIFAKKSTWIVMGVILLLLLVATGVTLAIVLSKRRKKAAAAQAAAAEQEQQMATLLDALEEAEGQEAAPETVEEEEPLGGVILDAQSERGMELRQQIRDFAEQSPEIAAQMLRNWLNGGELDGRRDG